MVTSPAIGGESLDSELAASVRGMTSNERTDIDTSREENVCSTMGMDDLFVGDPFIVWPLFIFKPSD